ncbi:hypothetical protein [Pseudomonas simiae]|uniref:hypothetical protein n=1 Tax=Pseudomonas simiae TaxID=321846 RepID=UPI00273720E2|nr:hypothetical protein [Pseudomonas simiae]WLH98689.1 hypothetical protein PSH95_14410 [Pseudomonas simiae]
MTAHKEDLSSLKKLEKYGLKLMELIPGLDKPATAIKYLREFNEEQKGIRIRRYCTALVNCISDGDCAAASELATDIEFADLLQACLNDSDSNKAEAYAQLTIALKFGSLDKEYRRHFMLSLKQLAHEDLELLRLAHIATKYELIPKHGFGVLSQSDIFNDRELGVIRSLSVGTLRQLGLIKPEGITDLGKLFITSVYSRELCDFHEGFKIWQSPPVIILTGGKKDNHNDAVIDNFKGLRIRCVTVPILSFPKGVDQYRPYKAIIFAGDYEGLTSSKHKELAAFTSKVPSQCINLGYKLSGTSDGMCSRYIDFGSALTLAEKVEKVARTLEFNVDI